MRSTRESVRRADARILAGRSLPSAWTRCSVKDALIRRVQPLEIEIRRAADRQPGQGHHDHRQCNLTPHTKVSPAGSTGSYIMHLVRRQQLSAPDDYTLADWSLLALSARAATSFVSYSNAKRFGETFPQVSGLIFTDWKTSCHSTKHFCVLRHLSETNQRSFRPKNSKNASLIGNDNLKTRRATCWHAGCPTPQTRRRPKSESFALAQSGWQCAFW